MTAPVDFMRRYRNLTVGYVRVSGSMCIEERATIQLRTYFMMNWTEGTEQRSDFNFVTQGGRNNAWYRSHRQQIQNAAVGKGAPRDYELALEWAVASGKIPNPSASTIQAFCDQRLGIDCSGFVTNWLIDNGLRPNTPTTAANTGSTSYFSTARAVNGIHDIRGGQLLVWMEGNRVKNDPGHVAAIESFTAQCFVDAPGGKMHVVEATGASNASPKLLDSVYCIEQIIDANGNIPMILVVKRHGVSGNRVAVMRP